MAKGIPPTVGNFILVLKSKLTQYDQRAKGGSMYRLGHFLEAASKVEDKVLRHANSTDEMTLPIAKAMVDAMAESFSVNLRDEFDLPPCRTVVKQINAFIQSGKLPSLVS